MRPSIHSFAVASVLLLLLGACGQKGPLFLPGNPSEIRPVETPDRELGDEDEENPGTIT